MLRAYSSQQMSQSKTNQRLLLARVAAVLIPMVAAGFVYKSFDGINPAFMIVAAVVLTLLALLFLRGSKRIQPEFDHVARARNLLAAIDRGGTPSNPAIINDIARGFGLEVSSKAPMQETIERIRQAVDRAS